MMSIVFGIVLLLIGAFSLCGAIFNWDWFFDYYKAIHLVRLFGRTGARVVYALIGMFIIVGGVSVLVLGHL